MSKNGGVGIYALKVMPMPWHGLWKFGTHAGGEVVDDHLEFCKARRRLGSNGRKDIEHATRVNDQLRNHTGDRLDLLSTEGLRGDLHGTSSMQSQTLYPNERTSTYTS